MSAIVLKTTGPWPLSPPGVLLLMCTRSAHISQVALVQAQGNVLAMASAPSCKAIHALRQSWESFDRNHYMEPTWGTWENRVALRTPQSQRADSVLQAQHTLTLSVCAAKTCRMDPVGSAAMCKNHGAVQPTG